VLFDKPYQVGDKAEYDSYNLRYMGTITAISDKTVTIQPDGEDKKVRMNLWDFCQHNHDWDVYNKQALNEIEMESL
jgi:hypothetical protein